MDKKIKRTRPSTSLSTDFQQNMMLEHGRVPPQATDVEEIVLGGLMLQKEAVAAVIDILLPEVFYLDNHKRIFAAIKNLFAKSEPIDILTVTKELLSYGELDIVGGPYYISQLTNRVVSSANIEFHARILQQKFIQRELIRISSEIIHDAYQDTTDVFDLLDRAESGLFQVGETNLRRSFLAMPELVKAAIKNIEAAKQVDNTLLGVGAGFLELDSVTQGWQKSDLIILAARPSMGKTAFALNLARNAAVDFKKPIAFFSLEMSSIQLVTRLISSESGLEAEKLRKGDLAGHEWQQLITRVDPLVKAKIFIDDTPQLSVFELRAKCRRLKQQHDIQMVFIDYLQLMTTGGENVGNREQEISAISRSLKSLAKELNIPVLALSQLSRSVESRPGSKKPILSDLRESGAIEQDADMVVFIYRPEYYGYTEGENNADNKGRADIIIAKHRNGRLAEIELKFVSKYARFDEKNSDNLKPSAPLNPNQNFQQQTILAPSRMDDISDQIRDEEPNY